MPLIAGLELIDSPLIAGQPLHHERRYVDGVYLGGWRLGRSEVEDSILGDPGVVGLVLNPPSSLRPTSPLLVGGVDRGEVCWVAPFSPGRVLLGDHKEYPGAAEVLHTAFSGFWDDVLYGLEALIDDPKPVSIWDPACRFGDIGVELGASGAPVHPMLRLLDLEGGLRLWCAMSTLQPRHGRFLAAYAADDVLDAHTGGALDGKKGVIEGKRGQAELAHFAVMSGRGWADTGAQLAAHAVGSVADTFANVWIRDLRGPRVWGRELWACDQTLPLTQQCDGCRRQR